MELATSKSLFMIPFPDVSVKAENKKTVFVSSELVCASRKLRRRIVRHMQEYNKWPKGYNTRVTLTYADHCDEISAIKFIDCTADITDGSDRDVFGKLPILSTYVWRMLNNWSIFHIQQIKQQLKERDSHQFCNWNKPAVINPSTDKDWNTVSRFEENMFGNMDPHKFLALVQGKNDLGLDDLHKVMENWFRLYNGRQVKLDKDGNEVSVEQNMTYKRNFRVDSNHYATHVNFYGPAIRSVPFNAKGWAWWTRDKLGNSNYSSAQRS